MLSILCSVAEFGNHLGAFQRIIKRRVALEVPLLEYTYYKFFGVLDPLQNQKESRKNAKQLQFLDEIDCVESFALFLIRA